MCLLQRLNVEDQALDLRVVQDAGVDGHAGVEFLETLHHLGARIQDGLLQVGGVGFDLALHAFGDLTLAAEEAFPTWADFADEATIRAVAGHAAKHLVQPRAFFGGGLHGGCGNGSTWREIDADFAKAFLHRVKGGEFPGGEIGGVLRLQAVGALQAPAEAHLADAALHVGKADEHAHAVLTQISAAGGHELLAGAAIQLQMRAAILRRALVVPALGAVAGGIGGQLGIQLGIEAQTARLCPWA